jgi:predicted MFS family arabinose efflux permease
MLGPAVALGLGRFAYALLLPAMRDQLGWSFTTAATLTTANALGYLVGAPAAGAITRRVGERRAFIWSLVVTTVTLFASAVSGELAVLLVLRAVAGAGGAVCFVAGAGLAAQAGKDLPQSRAATLLAVYFAGGGVGIVVSGLVIPAVLSVGNWQGAWLALGGLACLSMAGAIPAARAMPDTQTRAPNQRRNRPQWGRLSALLGCYALFGAGYIAYMTFIIAALKTTGAGPGEITTFWTILGISAAGAAFIWGPLLAGWRPGRGASLVLGILTVGALLPVFTTGVAAAIASAVLFGATFLTVVTAVTTAARRALPPQQWTSAIAILTTAFALGQCVGPLLSGALSDHASGVRAGLGIGAVLLAAAAGTALLHDHLLRHTPACPEPPRL